MKQAVCDNEYSGSLKPAPLGTWTFDSYLGQRIDKTAQARILSDHACQEIYPETEQAFRDRDDDNPKPNRGEWRGEFWGKWVLSAIAACQYYQSDELKDFISNAVKGLLSTQDPNGYIGTYKDSSYYERGTWNIWCRKYTLWGLIEAWELLGDSTILDAACKFCDHIMSEVGPGHDAIIETGQFCGLPSTSILTPVVKLYHATKKQDYLDFATYIVKQWSEHPSGIPRIIENGLADKPIQTWQDHPEEWAKSYEFISCIEGLVELYEITRNNDYLSVAENIYNQLVAWERSPVGSVSFNDKFIGSRFLKNTVAEICDAVYWNRLSFKLLMLTGDTKYLDEIERTLYNTLLCGGSPDGTWGLRRLRLSHVHIPAHKHFLNHHQCCVTNLPRGFFQAAEAAVFYDNDVICIGLYNQGHGSVMLPSGDSVELIIAGDMLAGERVKIIPDLKSSEIFKVRLRIPSWSSVTEISVNESPITTFAKAGSWFEVDREWHDGDVLFVKFDTSLRLEPFDTSVYEPNDPLVKWHEEQWANMGFIGEDNLNLWKSGNVALGMDDIFPHAPGTIACCGPVVLARDCRISGEAIFSPLNLDGATLKPLKDSPAGFWKVFELQLTNGQKVTVCDFASAGNTWDEKSKFNVWF